MGGACRLPPEWNGCKDKTDFCSKSIVRINDEQIDKTGAIRKLHFDQHFDELVLPRDAKLIKPKSEGVLNHVQYRRLFIQASNESVRVKGEYATSLFPTVYEELEKRGLVMPLELPENGRRTYPPHDQSWVPFKLINGEVNTAAARSVSGQGVRGAPLKLPDNLPMIKLDDILHSEASHDKESGLFALEDEPVSPVGLPAFSTDGTEMFLASMIERESDSWDLHLTTFLLCRDILQSDRIGLKATAIRPEKETIISWSKVVVAAYNSAHPQNDSRLEGPKYFCKIKASSGGEFYTVPGKLISNPECTEC